MQGRLKENGCDEDKVRLNGQSVIPRDQDTDFLQDGGGMMEIAGDADCLQDENIQA